MLKGEGSYSTTSSNDEQPNLSLAPLVPHSIVTLMHLPPMALINLFISRNLYQWCCFIDDHLTKACLKLGEPNFPKCINEEDI